jgi:hypothetical protein
MVSVFVRQVGGPPSSERLSSLPRAIRKVPFLLEQFSRFVVGIGADLLHQTVLHGVVDQLGIILQMHLL